MWRPKCDTLICFWLSIPRDNFVLHLCTVLVAMGPKIQCFILPAKGRVMFVAIQAGQIMPRRLTLSGRSQYGTCPRVPVHTTSCAIKRVSGLVYLASL